MNAKMRAGAIIIRGRRRLWAALITACKGVKLPCWHHAWNFILDNIRLTGYKNNMKKEAQLFKSMSDETRLKILGLWSGAEELRVCDVI